MKQVSCGDKIVELGSSADSRPVTRHLRGCDMENIDLIVICRGLWGHIEKL